MMKKYLFIICLVSFIFYTGCQPEIQNTGNANSELITSTENNGLITSTGESLTNNRIDAIDANNEADIKLNPEFLIDATNRLNSIGISDCWAGYDSRGDISVWINSSKVKSTLILIYHPLNMVHI